MDCLYSAWPESGSTTHHAAVFRGPCGLVYANKPCACRDSNCRHHDGGGAASPSHGSPGPRPPGLDCHALSLARLAGPKCTNSQKAQGRKPAAGCLADWLAAWLLAWCVPSRHRGSWGLSPARCPALSWSAATQQTTPLLNNRPGSFIARDARLQTATGEPTVSLGPPRSLVSVHLISILFEDDDPRH